MCSLFYCSLYVKGKRMSFEVVIFVLWSFSYFIGQTKSVHAVKEEVGWCVDANGKEVGRSKNQGGMTKSACNAQCEGSSNCKGFTHWGNICVTYSGNVVKGNGDSCCTCYLRRWVLVGSKKECTGSEIFKGYLPSLADCANECKGTASMFIFGTNDYGTIRCNNAGCRCFCETGADFDGSCNQKYNAGYRLYKYVGEATAVALPVKDAFASSIHSNGFDAKKAIDGNRETTFSSSGYNEMNPWLQVELQEIGSVDRVIIFNRKDCCGERTKNMRVSAGLTKFTTGINTLDIPENEICATYEGPGKDGEEIWIDCKASMIGRYVSVQLMQTTEAILNFGEIKIYGEPVPCVWENWSSSTWSNCSSACGGGSQNRTRTIKKKEGHNGTDCIEKVCSSKNVTENCGMQTQECNTNVLCPDPEQLGQGEIISIASGGVVALIIAAVVAVVMIRKKKSNGGKEITKPKQEPENEDDGYDIVTEARSSRDSGDIYGNIDEDIEFQGIENPYYDGEIEMSAQNTNDAKKKPNLNDTEVVTTIHNIYYEI